MYYLLASIDLYIVWLTDMIAHIRSQSVGDVESVSLVARHLISHFLIEISSAEEREICVAKYKLTN